MSNQHPKETHRITVTSNVVRQVRLLSLLHAAELAGIAPLSAGRVHQLVYLTDALAPVWDLVPLTPELLKLYGSPYDAGLQSDMDRMVGAGLVRARDLSYFQDDHGRWKVAAFYSLNLEASLPLLRELDRLPDEREAAHVTKEICLAVSALPPDVVDRVLQLDVAYSSPSSSNNTLVSLYDAEGTNDTSRVATQFQSLAPEGVTLNPAEQANLYIRHLYRIATHVA